MKTNGNLNLDGLIEEYNLPVWIKGYVIQYIKEDPIHSLKRAVTFIDVKRKRGVVTSKYVSLPNGTEFSMDSIVEILSLFYYGEMRIDEIAEKWSDKKDPEIRYTSFFSAVSKVEKKHVRAIKNLLGGLMRKPVSPNENVKALFEYIENLTDWNERFVALYIILRYSYSEIFGKVFYKVFYFVMPEFMRSFGKVYINEDMNLSWAVSEAKRIVSNKLISHDDLISLSENLLPYISATVKYEMPIAKEADIEREAKLMLRVAILYPLHELKDLGVDIDIDKEEGIIDKKSDSLIKR